MITTINKDEFINSFMSSDNYKHKYSREALNALYDYLENLEESLDEQFEFDMVSICCEWTEYDNLDEVQENYNNIESVEDLEEKTEVIQFTNSDKLIIRNF